jgi:hypothetical protein
VQISSVYYNTSDIDDDYAVGGGSDNPSEAKEYLQKRILRAKEPIGPGSIYLRGLGPLRRGEVFGCHR